MVEAAKSAGVNIFSITEHISQFKLMRQLVKFTSLHESGRLFENFEEYENEFLKVRRGADSIQVRIGLEVDYLKEYENILKKQIMEREDLWEILLCSVHELSHGLDIEKKDLPQDQERSLKRWKEYFEIQEMALRSDFIPFDVLTHPTRLGVSTPIYPEDIQERLNHLAMKAFEREKALELNGTDLLRMPELVSMVAKACSYSKCKVSFGSDAHRPERVSIAFPLVSKLAKEMKLEFWIERSGNFGKHLDMDARVL